MTNCSHLERPLQWSVIPRRDMSPSLYEEIVAFCTQAYEEDLTALMATFSDGVHVIGTDKGRLVTHALWVTRWLQAGAMASLRTAYVEAVATHPDCRRRGHGGQVMRRIAAEIRGFDLAALSPAYAACYAGLGWESWRGPLLIRTGSGLIPIPYEEVMILRLPRTAPLDLDVPLSAEWREGELW